MNRRSNTAGLRRRQQGMLLIMAVILVTTIAAAVALFSATLTGRSLSTARHIEATQAYYAAYSAVQYAIERARRSVCTGSETLNIEGFTVDLRCREQTHREADQSYSVFALDAHARRGDPAAGSLVSRRVAVQVCVAAADADLGGCLTWL